MELERCFEPVPRGKYIDLSSISAEAACARLKELGVYGYSTDCDEVGSFYLLEGRGLKIKVRNYFGLKIDIEYNSEIVSKPMLDSVPGILSGEFIKSGARQLLCLRDKLRNTA